MKDWWNRTDRLLVLFFGVCVLAVAWFLLQLTCVTSFRIPTDSMYPTLQPGDNILVNKSIMGARIFNIWEAAEEKEVDIYRLPGIGKVKRNDVLVLYGRRYLKLAKVYQRNC